MKWTLLMMLVVMGLQTHRVVAADKSLQVLAARQELQQFIKTTNTRLRDLEEALQAQQRRITELEDQNRQLRSDIARMKAMNPAAGLDRDIRGLANSIKEVDEKRLADNRKILEQLRVIRSGITSKPSASPTPTPATPKIDSNAEPVAYKIQKGDTSLYRIVSNFKEAGHTTSVSAIQRANPEVDWNRLQIGQKILVPLTKN